MPGPRPRPRDRRPLPLQDTRSRDYQLFGWSPIASFTDVMAMHAVRDDLRRRDYRTVDMDVSRPDRWTRAAAQVEEWPDGEVRDLSTFDWALRSLTHPATAFVVTGYDALVANDPDEDVRLLDSLVRTAWEHAVFGRVLVTLVHAAEPFQRTFGGHVASSWAGQWWDE